MCDLLGLSFNTAISAKISLDIFQKRGDVNPDGWGLAFYQDERLQVIKDAHSAIDSTLYDFMERYIHTSTLISHVRRSTMGVPSYLNTHPFYRRLQVGSKRREIAFAHNGTLTRLEGLHFSDFTPLGETDSEQIFCHLLEAISTKMIDSWTKDEFTFIEQKLREINDEHNTLNCLFSDGSYLFCYSDINDHNNGLRFTSQVAPFGTVDLVGSDEKMGSIELRTEIPSSLDQSGYLISTRILTSGKWTELTNGELVVFKDGYIVYPSTRV